MLINTPYMVQERSTQQKAGNPHQEGCTRYNQGMSWKQYTLLQLVVFIAPIAAYQLGKYHGSKLELKPLVDTEMKIDYLEDCILIPEDNQNKEFLLY